jgi:Fusaric acid resistance protein family
MGAADGFHRLAGTAERAGSRQKLLPGCRHADRRRRRPAPRRCLRTLFLGTLAIWIGLCTFGSQYAIDFSAYAFILSGYTAAIVGVPGALSANDAFYIATARITEICLGIKDGDGAEPEHPAPKGQIRTWLAGYFHRRYGAAAA